MAERILKYQIKGERTEKGIAIAMPPNGRILCLQEQRDVPTIWVLFDTRDLEQEPVIRYFKTIATGMDFEAPEKTRRNYLGTYKNSDGEVWHGFEFVDY